MTALPEHYQKPYAAPAGQPIAPSAVIQPTTQSLGVPEGMRVIGYTRDLDRDLLVPVYGPKYEPVERTPPRDLAPQKLMDPTAQRLMGAGIGGGVFAAGVGYGIGQVLNGLAGIGSGALMWLAILLVAARVAPVVRPVKGGDTYNINNRWWGKSTIRN